MINIDIIAMAREIADPEKVDPWDEQCGWCVLTQAELERLAAAIRADAIAEEREACAKVCDDWPNGRDDVYSISVAIRARLANARARGATHEMAI